MRKEKQIVKDFYNSFGWQINSEGIYNDSALFIARGDRNGSSPPLRAQKIVPLIKKTGEYFLEIGCGAKPYTEGSKGYSRHICVDFSIVGLKECPSKLKEKGLYVLADATSLPFDNNFADAVISSHAIYHIPRDEQQTAVAEMCRVLKDNSQCIIISHGPVPWLTKIAKMLSKMAGKNISSSSVPPLYFYGPPYSWWKKLICPNCKIEIRCFRLFDTSVIDTFAPNKYLNILLRRAIFFLEVRFPHLLAPISAYHLIIIHKEQL
jgi:SAM-dependent methyltransferase